MYMDITQSLGSWKLLSEAQMKDPLRAWTVEAALCPQGLYPEDPPMGHPVGKEKMRSIKLRPGTDRHIDLDIKMRSIIKRTFQILS